MGHSDGAVTWLCAASLLLPLRQHSASTDCMSRVCWLCNSSQGEESFADAKLMTDEQLEGKLRFHTGEVERLEGEVEARKRTPSKEQAE